MRSKCPTLPLSHSTSISSHYGSHSATSISSHYGSHSAMTWRWNNAVKNYVLINRLLPQIQKTLWIYAKNILNSRLSILSKMAHWLRHRRGDVGRPPSDALFVLHCRLRRTRRIKDLHVTGLKTVQIMKNSANQRSTRHRTENCSNIFIQVVLYF
jgi:hypothetical protein